MEKEPRGRDMWVIEATGASYQMHSTCVISARRTKSNMVGSALDKLNPAHA